MATMTFARRAWARGWIFALGLLLVAAASAHAAPQLKKFDWTHAVTEEATVFRIDFDETPQVRITDDLAIKRYLYVDFYGAAAPRPAQAGWTLDKSPIYHVKQMYYPSQKVLRYVFYARPGSVPRYELSRHGDGAFRLVVKPVRILALGKAQGAGGSRKLVVLDPGHGGTKLEGAKTSRKINGRTWKEDELVLQIGKKLEKLIRQSPNLDVVMTRTDDRYVSLPDRVRFTDKTGGDLFLSIHLNASDSRKKTARGFEIYYLSDGSRETNRTLLALENDEMLEEDPAWKAEENGLKELLKSLSNEKFIQQKAQSRHLCEMIDAEFKRAGPFRQWDRGVKSNAFRVLMNYNMPTVLAECGFLDTPAEARELIKPEVQDKIAALLFNGINRYFAAVDPEFTPYGVAVEP